MVATRDCGLCGKPLLPDRFLCADHAALALEAAHVYRQNRGKPGAGLVWMEDPTKKEKLNV